MTEFAKSWKEVKLLAQACVTEPELVRLMNLGEQSDITPEEEAYLENVLEKYNDALSIYYISDMIRQVENALADGREESARFEVVRMYHELSSDLYFENVFNGDESSEEWKRIAAFRDGLYKLVQVC